ncbi:hypothetical protein EWM64_g7319 [Hericium alpestre]|uniref:Uncharacterized protein n=1 Tax=Hericium alpestre TaxID=135208 RepID=A0A4Y9ZPI8_9AGAM|nr:hypothetical protein EWM64_g7319 [Hericium alpestre]
MATAGLVSRRVVSTGGKGKEAKAEAKPRAHDHSNHDVDAHGSHSHARGIFGHTHSHDENGNGHEHKHGHEVMQALQNRGDRGSRITLIGLASNVVLTSAKGVAGWYMNSAALLADAGHSLSDLLGDFVVLFSWRLSRRPPSEKYPYGFAKFETLGTTIVSLLLIGGALGIGAHSLSLLMTALSETAATLPPGAIQTAVVNVTQAAHNIPAIGHTHADAAHVLDPNAAWFAAVSVVWKEWLFRITRKVGEQENSPVLMANAWHHRSDAYSSVVALVAILGSSWFPALPLDPIGGLLVSVVILQQGLSIFGGAFGQLTDAGVSPSTIRVLSTALEKYVTSEAPNVHGTYNLRARRAGASLFVDLVADVQGSLSVEETQRLEEKIHDVLKKAKAEVAEVNVKFRPVTRRWAVLFSAMPGGGFATAYLRYKQLIPPTDPGVETMVIAEIYLDAIVPNKFTADKVDTYSRHDLMHLVVTGSNGDPVKYISDVKSSKELQTTATGEDVE